MDNNNIALIEGTITKEPQFNHEVCGEKFYMMHVSVQRLSPVYDEILVLIPERGTNMEVLVKGTGVFVKGQFRSYNRHEGNKSRLILYLFAEEIMENPFGTDKNSVMLEGYVCKPTTYRRTPLNREIADVLIAVNRNNGKSDYIPCIAWGRNARYVNELEVGIKVCIEGRIQSRIYNKRQPDGNIVDKVAYEVSVSTIREVGLDLDI